MIYEDQAIVAKLQNPGASLGHISIAPKKSVANLSDLEYEEALQLFWAASFSATAVFETLGAQGSNIVVHDGKEVSVEVFARNPDDGLSLQWQPQQGDAGSVEANAKKISEAFWFIGKEEQNAPKPNKQPVNTQKKIVSDEDDLRIQHLKRRF